jgi:hypothetical protein
MSDYDAKFREENQKRRDILAYGHIVAAERAEHARACAWQEYYSLARKHMDDLHPVAAVGLSEALQKAKHTAEEGCLEAEAALTAVPFHFRLFDPNYISRNLPGPD